MNYQRIEDGENYSQVIVSEMATDQFDLITMEWSDGSLIELREKSIFVDSIRIISLSKINDNQQQQNLEMIFNPESKEITNRNSVRFHKI